MRLICPIRRGEATGLWPKMCQNNDFACQNDEFVLMASNELFNAHDLFHPAPTTSDERSKCPGRCAGSKVSDPTAVVVTYEHMPHLPLWFLRENVDRRLKLNRKCRTCCRQLAAQAGVVEPELPQ